MRGLGMGFVPNQSMVETNFRSGEAADHGDGIRIVTAMTPNGSWEQHGLTKPSMFPMSRSWAGGPFASTLEPWKLCRHTGDPARPNELGQCPALIREIPRNAELFGELKVALTTINSLPQPHASWAHGQQVQADAFQTHGLNQQALFGQPSIVASSFFSPINDNLFGARFACP
eukprot:Skav229197  [mRNA]  locus=scaffold1004:491467:493689:- [translate_table: standard]